MSKELTVSEKEQDFAVIEQVIMQGDLSKLNPMQRVSYYRKVCDSAGLNPFTRPFDYIVLNGKLTLYAKKDATEQLRKLNGISITKLEDKLIDDLYVVKATAKDKDGRTDEATGAVSIGHLKGEQKANAIMKAETKAKRRVTLSISGLGWTDETEIESIPNAKKVDVDLQTGEIISQPILERVADVGKKVSNSSETILLESPICSTDIPKHIDENQWKELKILISQCTQKAQDHLWKQLETMEIISDDDYKTMDLETFLKMKNACMGNIAKQKKDEKKVA